MRWEAGGAIQFFVGYAYTCAPFCALLLTLSLQSLKGLEKERENDPEIWTDNLQMDMHIGVRANLRRGRPKSRHRAPGGVFARPPPHHGLAPKTRVTEHLGAFSSTRRGRRSTTLASSPITAGLESFTRTNLGVASLSGRPRSADSSRGAHALQRSEGGP